MITENLVVIVGRIGVDPEVRALNDGRSHVCNLRVATEHQYQSGNGEPQKETTWHTVVAWNRTAQNIAAFAQKGTAVYVRGRLRNRKWEDKEGRTRYETEIVAEFISFLNNTKQSSTDEEAK